MKLLCDWRRQARADTMTYCNSESRTGTGKTSSGRRPSLTYYALGNKFNIMQLKGLIPEGILRTVKAEYWVRKTSLRAALRLGPATPVTSSAAHLHYPAPVGTAYLAHMCIQLSRLIRHLTRRGNLSAHGQAGTGLHSLRLTIL